MRLKNVNGGRNVAATGERRSSVVEWNASRSTNVDATGEGSSIAVEWDTN